MLGKLLGRGGTRILTLLTDSVGEVEIMLDPTSDEPLFTLGGAPLVPDPAGCAGIWALEPFLLHRKKLNKPLVGTWDGRSGALGLTLDQDNPMRRYQLWFHPARRTYRYSEQLVEAVDSRLPLLQPAWSRQYNKPPWPPRINKANLSGAFLGELLVLVVGDRVIQLEPTTGQVLAAWPLPAPPGSSLQLTLLHEYEGAALGSYRILKDGYLPDGGGMLLLKMCEDGPRWKLFPGQESVRVDEPVAPAPGRTVIETRVYSGEDYIPSRAQWVIEEEPKRAYTAVVGGPPVDGEAPRFLGLAENFPNELVFESKGSLLSLYSPRYKLRAHPSLETREAPDTLRRAAFWSGRGLAFELTSEMLRIHGWLDPGLEFARCHECGTHLPHRAHRCACGAVYQA